MHEPTRTALPWLADTTGRQSTLRLFCFPHAGGGASTFRPWLDDGRRHGIQVCPVQPPGREGRWSEPALGRVEDLAADFVRAALPLLTEPFALLGNSLGALVAFETARYLQAHGLPVPVRLVVAAAAAPGTGARRTPLSALPDREFAGELQRRYGGIPDLILNNPEYLQEYLPTLRSDIAAVESYRPEAGPVLDCPVTALVGSDDAGVPVSAVNEWRGLTSGAFDRHVLHGGHFALLQHRDVVFRTLDVRRTVGPAGSRPAPHRGAAAC
ncbi:thioesterase II family protein [Micromonospora sp. BQ11]|uniref:thioesterase II family protein n=1 Tax=Micromonospora sp. BQ11 TaxID=3452212 RepID=UPI003F88A6CB